MSSIRHQPRNSYFPPPTNHSFASPATGKSPKKSQSKKEERKGKEKEKKDKKEERKKEKERQKQAEKEKKKGGRKEKKGGSGTMRRSGGEREKEESVRVDDILKGGNIFDATRNGDLEQLKSLLHKGLGVAAQNEKGQTVVHIASANGHIRILAYIVSLGKILVDCFDHQGHTALHLAMISGQIETVKWLIQNGANAELTTSKSHKNIFDIAAEFHPRLTPNLSQFWESSGFPLPYSEKDRQLREKPKRRSSRGSGIQVSSQPHLFAPGDRLSPRSPSSSSSSARRKNSRGNSRSPRSRSPSSAINIQSTPSVHEQNHISGNTSIQRRRSSSPSQNPTRRVTITGGGEGAGGYFNPHQKLPSPGMDLSPPRYYLDDDVPDPKFSIAQGERVRGRERRERESLALGDYRPMPPPPSSSSRSSFLSVPQPLSANHFQTQYDPYEEMEKRKREREEERDRWEREMRERERLREERERKEREEREREEREREEREREEREREEREREEREGEGREGGMRKMRKRKSVHWGDQNQQGKEPSFREIPSAPLPNDLSKSPPSEGSTHSSEPYPFRVIPLPLPLPLPSSSSSSSSSATVLSSAPSSAPSSLSSSAASSFPPLPSPFTSSSSSVSTPCLISPTPSPSPPSPSPSPSPSLSLISTIPYKFGKVSSSVSDFYLNSLFSICTNFYAIVMGQENGMDKCKEILFSLKALQPYTEQQPEESPSLFIKPLKNTKNAISDVLKNMKLFVVNVKEKVSLEASGTQLLSSLYDFLCLSMIQLGVLPLMDQVGQLREIYSLLSKSANWGIHQATITETLFSLLHQTYIICFSSSHLLQTKFSHDPFTVFLHFHAILCSPANSAPVSSSTCLAYIRLLQRQIVHKSSTKPYEESMYPENPEDSMGEIEMHLREVCPSELKKSASVFRMMFENQNKRRKRGEKAAFPSSSSDIKSLWTACETFVGALKSFEIGFVKENITKEMKGKCVSLTKNIISSAETILQNSLFQICSSSPTFSRLFDLGVAYSLSYLSFLYLFLAGKTIGDPISQSMLGLALALRSLCTNLCLLLTCMSLYFENFETMK